ncbi:ABC transporter ATP-binding protein [Pantoea sp. Ap-967]|uniref:ABC transporter ATP-binding protein n=1 Tax=Pantoea sp. Ap-967 TaxID=2608362 RepID=UPI0014222A4B|nr:ABC transporter ATP-binding protein [Pantoea sp. Ap-967]NIE78419.1 ABC transporter ATP-binding protein [Pantoea sp. Ap-967]
MNMLLAVFRITQSPDTPRVWRSIGWRLGEALFATVPYGVLYIALRELFAQRLDGALLGWLTLALLLSLALQLACNLASNLGGFLGGTGMLCDLRLQLAAQLRRLPLGFHSRNRSGELSAVLGENATQVEEAFTHLTGELFGRLGIAVLSGALMLLVDWRLGLVALLAVAAGSLLAAALRQRFAAMSRAKHAQRASVASQLLAFVQGIKVIRAFGLSAERFGALQASMLQLRRLSIRIEVVAGLLAVGFAVLLEIGLLALLGLAVYLAVQGQLAPASLILTLVLAHRFFAMLGESATLMAQLAFYRKSLERIENLLQAPCLPEPASSREPQGHGIEVRNLHFSHPGGAVALRGIDFDAPAGSITALVGASGAGKTTLAQLLARFHDADQGQVLIGGVDVRQMRQDDLLARIAFVFQDNHLFADTVANNLRIARPEASDAELEAAARAACCHAFIMALPDGYQTRLGQGLDLSGGERQRLSIARALLKDAPIVILDEATAALDSDNEAAITQALNALTRNKTVIVIAHRLYTLTQVQQILVLDQQTIAERGTHAELLAAGGLYARFWAQQQATRHWRLRPRDNALA